MFDRTRTHGQGLNICSSGSDTITTADEEQGTPISVQQSHVSEVRMAENRGVEDSRGGEPNAKEETMEGVFNSLNNQDYFKRFETKPYELSFLAVHDFRRLHMRNIHYYQMELLHNFPKHKQLGITGDVTSLRTLLAGYTQALQNYEYVLRLPKPSKNKITAQRNLLEKLGSYNVDDCNDHRVIRGNKVGLLEGLFSQHGADVADGGDLSFEDQRTILSYSLSWTNIIRRVAIGAGVGAPFLLVPMIILRFHDTMAWTLGTVSTAVVLFSVFLGVCSSGSNGELLAAVAAYAAVMVVFIGTTTKPAQCDLKSCPAVS